MSFRYASGINKPGFNPLAVQTSTLVYNLYSWGRNTFGRLGLGDTVNRSSPTQVGSLTTWATLSISGGPRGIAIKTDGTLWSWGVNNSGQLGLGNTTNYSSPKQVGALTNWLTVANGYYSTLAIKTDGTLWAWGDNAKGQLGLGNTTSYSSPKQVGALTAWSKISCGQDNTMAIKTNGTLWAWGNNAVGMLGVGNTTNYSSPVQVGALTNWLNVASVYASIATKTDGTLWTWGFNTFGQLGNGNTTNYSSPVQVGALTNWSKVGTNAYSCFSIKNDGTLWSWGYNANGALGLGNTTSYSSPKQVGALTNWSILSVSNAPGGNANCIKTDGTLWTWGTNTNGELGLGNTTSYNSPKQVGSLTTWLSVSSCYQFSMAIG